MAGLSSFLKVTVLGDAKPMNSAMKKAAKDVDALGKDIKKVAGGISKAFAGMGLAIGLGGLAQMAKAAGEDRASMAKLENSIRNATGASEEQIKASDAVVQSLSNQVGISDDDLRPALQKLVLATGDLTTAQQLLPIAADLAAAANVDLSTASSALAKAQTGNTTALVKLLPALKGVADPMAEVQRLTNGAAEAAGNADPFKKLSIIFENLTETIGGYLLPYIDAFSKWLTSEEGQEKLQMLADGFGMIFTNLFNMFQFLSDNSWILATVGALLVLVGVWRSLYVVTKAVYAATKGASIAEMVKKAVSGGVGWQGVAMGLAAVAAGIGAFVAIDAMVGDMGNVALPKVPEVTKLKTPEIQQFTQKTLNGLKDKTGGVKALTKAQEKASKLLEDSIKTVQAKLDEVRQAIIAMATKFFNAVELGFGIVSRGAGKMFRADRYVRELKRMQLALADFQTNLKTLQDIGGKQATPLLNQILGMSPEEGAAVLRGFVQSPQMFQEALASTKALAAQGGAVGRAQSLMNGNQTEQQMLQELKLLRAELAKGKNTYNIKSNMTAEQILNAIKTWEKKTKKKVLVG